MAPCGQLQPYAGAATHDRRYRMFFDAPIAFRKSAHAVFEVFDGVDCQSVLFWYQAEPGTTQLSTNTVEGPLE